MSKEPAPVRWAASVVWAVSALVLLGAQEGRLTSAPEAEVRLFAASSLTDALQDVIHRLRSFHPEIRIVFQFGASSDLARQIEAGAPADLFFSADSRQMDRLEQQKGLEPGTRRDVLSNQLVIVVPRTSALVVEGPFALERDQVRRIALAEPTIVPAGVYGRQYLESRSLWDKLQTKIIPTIDVRAALAAVATGNVDAGIVYRTDAAIESRVRVAYVVPLEQGPRIVYPLAGVRSRWGAAPRTVHDFLLSQRARAVFERFGFIVLDASGESSPP